MGAIPYQHLQRISSYGDDHGDSGVARPASEKALDSFDLGK